MIDRTLPLMFGPALAIAYKHERAKIRLRKEIDRKNACMAAARRKT